jgi:5-methyltetrahydropteroyltriglutamate--homocysteine methyltransferase
VFVTAEIKTTHVGSLPRSAEVTDLLFAAERGEAVDERRFDETMTAAVAEAVRRQVDAGIDLVSDGEMAKISYATYIKDRITGFDGDSPRRPPADLEEFPGFLQRQASSGGTPTYRRPRCVGEVKPLTLDPLEADVRRFAEARAQQGEPAGFMNAASPGVIALFQPNDYYPDDDTYLEALAEAMRPEYEAIVAAGLVLQLDSPDLGLGRHMMYKDRDDEGLSAADRAACGGAEPRTAQRACRPGPDARLLGQLRGPAPPRRRDERHPADPARGKPAGLLFETANPRHQHDLEAFTEHRSAIPEDKVLIPGVIDSTTNFIEHPRVVANRVRGFVDLVGAERVIAGTDCGFSTFAGFGAVDPDIVYAKLATLAEGAELAATAP